MTRVEIQEMIIGNLLLDVAYMGNIYWWLESQSVLRYSCSM